MSCSASTAPPAAEGTFGTAGALPWGLTPSLTPTVGSPGQDSGEGHGDSSHGDNCRRWQRPRDALSSLPCTHGCCRRAASTRRVPMAGWHPRRCSAPAHRTGVLRAVPVPRRVAPEGDKAPGVPALGTFPPPAPSRAWCTGGRSPARGPGMLPLHPAPFTAPSPPPRLLQPPALTRAGLSLVS